MKNIYVFGNEYLEFDNFAKEIANEIKGKANFIHCRTPDFLLDVDEEEITILDVVKGIKKTTIIKDISRIKANKLLSLHDFDLGYFLKLMKEMGTELKVSIIGIPQSGDTKKIAKQVEACI
jgi:hypothetical protein